jgi:hypothetical protein
MATPHQNLAEPSNVGYEHSTISVRGVVWFVVILIAFGAVAHIIIWLIWYMLDQALVPVTVAPTAQTRAVTITPAPRLQPSPGEDHMPWEDLQDMRRQEHAEFARRGWVDPRSGKVAIPQRIVDEVIALSAKPPVGGSADARKGKP